MIDLRDRVAEFEAAAVRLLAAPRRVVVRARPARCHPDRPLDARGLCRACYAAAYNAGRHNEHRLERVSRSRADFVADYVLLRSEGYTRRQIAERLGMTVAAVTQAHRRAVAAGDLTPDRRL